MPQLLISVCHWLLWIVTVHQTKGGSVKMRKLKLLCTQVLLVAEAAPRSLLMKEPCL